MRTRDRKPGCFFNSLTICIETTPKAHQMIRKVWIFTLSTALAFALIQRPALAQYGPPASGSSAAILFAPATLGLEAGLNGQGYSGNGGAATAAQFNFPAGMAYDSTGDLYIVDSGNNVVRKVNTSGIVSAVAGNNTFPNTFALAAPPANTQATSWAVGRLQGLAIDSSNNFYFADITYNVIWKVTTSTGVITVFAGTPGTSGYTGDGAAATSATLNDPVGLAFDSTGNLYVADAANNVVRVIATNGKIATFAGDGIGAGIYNDCPTAFSGGAGLASAATICNPQGLAVDRSGNVYISSYTYDQVYIVGTNGKINVFAGSGLNATSSSPTFSGDGGPASSAQLWRPAGLYADPAGDVYIVDQFGSDVRQVNAAGTITSVYGISSGGDVTRSVLGQSDTESNTSLLGDTDGLGYVTMDPYGDLIISSADASVVFAAGSTGQYRFPQTQILTPETTTQANATSIYYPPYVTISNPSGVTLNFTAVPTVTGPFAVVTGTGAGTCVFPGSLAPGQNCTVVLSFTPTLGNSTTQTGSVAFATNANSSPSITLSGVGVGTATVSATLGVSPLTFTSAAGVTSASQNATLTNTGQLPIAIGSTNFNGFSPTDFAISAQTCPTGSATLAVGASCTYSITFTPPGSTTYSAGFQVCVTTSSYGCLQSITLQGTGTAGATATLLPTPLAFGSVYVGQTSAAAIATLTNTSSSSISIASFGISGINSADFAVTTGTNACASTLAAGANCNVYVTFTPVSAASFSAQLSVTDSASGSPQSVAITGTGLKFISNVGTALAAQAVTVTISTAGTPATINVLTLGAPNLDFTSASGSACSTSTAYTVGQTCTVNVVFTPAYPGQRLGAVVLTNSSGIAIGTTNLIGTGNGPQIGFMPGTQSASLGSGFNNPIDVAVDGAGNIYVADFTNNAVKEIVAASGYTTVNTLGSGFFEPSGVAVDGTGNVYVADFYHKFVKEMLAVNGVVPASPTILTLGSGFNGPAGVAVDGNGNVFVADSFANAVSEIVAVNGSIPASPTIRTLGSGFTGPTAIAVDASGDVFIADSGNNAVKEIVAVNGSIPTSSPTITTLGSGFSAPQGVAVDAIGNVYVADTGNNNIKEIVAVGGSIPTSPTILTLGTVNDFAFPRGVAVDGHGNVIVPDYGDNRVVKLDYADAPALTFPTATPVGSADTTDNPVTLTVENIGNAILTFPAPASGNRPTITGSFSLGSAGTCAQLTSSSSAATLTEGSSCTLLINFTPATSGTNTGALGFTDTSLNASSPNYAAQNVALSGTGTSVGTPKATLSQIQLSYPNTNIGSSSAAQTFTITNTGTAVLNLSSIALGGATPGDFTMSNNCGATLAVNAFCTVSVTFSPGFPRLSLASVLVTDNASGSPQSVVITGTGIAATPQATLSSPVAFASTNVGSSAPTQVISLSNPGNATLTITSIAITGTNATSFSTTTCGTTLAASGTCLITIGFTPTAAGPLSATLTVTDNATAGSTQSVALSGTGATLTAQASFGPTSLTFASTTVGTISAALTTTLTNGGTAALAISSIGLTGTNAGSFSQTNNCGTSLAAGSFCTITVTFTPSTAGTLSASVAVADNAAASPQTVTLSGTGTAPLAPSAALSPNPLNFSGTTAVGTSAAALPMTLTNGGTAALTISSIAVTGANASSFSQTNNCGASLAAGSSCIISVVFTPASAAALTASLTVTDNATGSPQSATITGTGAAVVTAGTFTVASATTTTTVQPGGAAQFNLTIAPLGGSYNNLVTLTATGLPPGALVSFSPAAVTPGSAGAPSVMSIQTATGLAHNELPSQHGSHFPMLAMLAGLPLLGFAGNLRRLRKCRGRWMLLGLTFLAILPLLALSGCGGGYFGPAPKTYAITVTGTSGSLQESTTVSITVQ